MVDTSDSEWTENYVLCEGCTRVLIAKKKHKRTGRRKVFVIFVRRLRRSTKYEFWCSDACFDEFMHRMKVDE